jgi:hypothetical protein
MPKGPKGEKHPGDVIGAASWSPGLPLARSRALRAGLPRAFLYAASVMLLVESLVPHDFGNRLFTNVH